MVDILLLILKILLWVILAVLGIVLFIILLVLFAPISYKADIDYIDQAKVRAKVNFLVVSFSVLYDQTAKKLDTVLKICGISFGGKDKPEKKKRVKRRKKADDDDFDNIDLENDDDTEDDIEDDVQNDTEHDDDTVIDDIEKHDIENSKADVVIAESDSDETNENEDDAPSKKKIKKQLRKQQKEEGKQQKQEKKEAAGDVKRETADKLERIKKKVERFQQFWSLKCTAKTRAYLKKYIIGAVRHIGPRRIKGYLIYGFDDPATTGNVTGYLSLMPFCYQKDFTLTPDFYNKIIECKVKIKGHFCIGYFLRIVFNINIWRTFFAAKKYLAD